MVGWFVMKDHKCIKDLEKELEEFQKEKERVKNIIGKIGGKKRSVYGRYANTLFICIVLSVFFIGGIFHKISFMLSIEIGVLLTSLKIAWMIHQQEKVNHKR